MIVTINILFILIGLHASGILLGYLLRQKKAALHIILSETLVLIMLYIMYSLLK